MVVDLCLPAFQTEIHCNKLCADGYDVTNLVSADPASRRRGFKLEYFVRPPLQVTLTFGVKVELCRVDVELWPWGMDRGQACKKLEISTCSDSPSSVCCNEIQQKKRGNDSQRKDSNLPPNNGRLWSAQAQTWAEEPLNDTQSSPSQHNRNSAGSEFKLVGRCELREETRVCFSHSHFRARPPFESPPPPPPSGCRQEALWSRGGQSLGGVAQLRVALPFGGAASALGLKSLSVWAQPARCCPAEQVEKIHKAHMASVRRTALPVSVSPLCPPKPQKKAPTSQSFSVPEEFLDPITQEVMVLPMLLPGGASVDHSTLEEYQRREAAWGRLPNDPFTGVPFTPSSQPLPHPQLKSRIDHFLLRNGQLCQDGRLGRREEDKNPQPSRLVASEADTGTDNSGQTEINAVKEEQVRKRDVFEDKQVQQLPPAKKPRSCQVLDPTCSSHEQRLSVSLDEALSSALRGRPSFTSNLSLDTPPRTEPQMSPLRPTEGTSTGISVKKCCSGCSCSLSVYASSSSPFYRLSCGHFLCRSCLQTPPKPLDNHGPAASGQVSCPNCRSPTPRSDVTRVHH